MQNIILKSTDDPSILYQSNSNSFILGRGEGADLIIPENGISRKHAQFNKYGSNCYIKDLGSTNGTFIGNVALIPREVYFLRTKDIIRFGIHSFYLDGPPVSLGDPSLSAFGDEIYQGEFFIGSSTSFSYGGSSATIPSKSLGTDELIFLVRREGAELIISQKSREFSSYLNGSEVQGRQVLKDRDRITIGNLLLLISIPSALDIAQEEEIQLKSTAEVPSYLKDRMGDEGWDDPLKRRKSTGTLLAIEKVIEESKKSSQSSPEQGIHRFSTANLRIAEANIKKDKMDVFLGIFTIVTTIFMGGILLYLY